MTLWLDLQSIKCNKSDRNKYHMLSLICGIFCFISIDHQSKSFQILYAFLFLTFLVSKEFIFISDAHLYWEVLVSSCRVASMCGQEIQVQFQILLSDFLCDLEEMLAVPPRDMRRELTWWSFYSALWPVAGTLENTGPHQGFSINQLAQWCKAGEWPSQEGIWTQGSQLPKFTSTTSYGICRRQSPEGPIQMTVAIPGPRGGWKA